MKRFRSYRINQETRDKNAEISLVADDFIYPYFVVEGEKKQNAIPDLTGIYQLSIDNILHDVEECMALGINKFLLFGVIDGKQKDAFASAATQKNNLVAKTVFAIKQNFPQALVITDICMCGYTNHGHCGIIEGNQVDNDKTLPILAEMALSHAKAGADFVAPSSMMDGQVLAIRKLLDKNNYQHVKVLGYSAKFASSFYGPFRSAAGSAPSFGDRKSYQMDYRVSQQALEEVQADIDEGASWVMVKPAHTYLDILAKTKLKFPHKKLAAYHVSGEYMLIKLAAKNGLLEENQAMFETLYAIKRAGTDYIITYFAKDAAKCLQE